MASSTAPDDLLQTAPEVAAALAEGRPVVALESTIISHGLPRPDNLRVAREVEAAVRAEGAVPATLAVVGGRARVGLDDDAPAVVATAHLAARAGIRVFATGGLGGVHRGAATTYDESADLVTLARTGVTVVCAGVKSILDVPATLERLETFGVGVLGYGTTEFPGFYLSSSGEPLEHRVDTPEQVAAVMRARRLLGTDRTALVVANPLPPDEQLDPVLHDRVLRESLDAAAADGVHGKGTTPYLLSRFHRETGGASLRVNTTIILRNATLAGRIACADAKLDRREP